jgi:hypothetical protein
MFLIAMVSLGFAALFLMATRGMDKDPQRRSCRKKSVKRKPKSCRKPAKAANRRRSCLRQVNGTNAADETEEDDSDEEEEEESDEE